MVLSLNSISWLAFGLEAGQQLADRLLAQIIVATTSLPEERVGGGGRFLPAVMVEQACMPALSCLRIGVSGDDTIFDGCCSTTKKNNGKPALLDRYPRKFCSLSA